MSFGWTECVVQHYGTRSYNTKQQHVFLREKARSQIIGMCSNERFSLGEVIHVQGVSEHAEWLKSHFYGVYHIPSSITDPFWYLETVPTKTLWKRDGSSELKTDQEGLQIYPWKKPDGSLLYVRDVFYAPNHGWICNTRSDKDDRDVLMWANDVLNLERQWPGPFHNL